MYDFFSFKESWNGNEKLLFLSSDHLRYENGQHVSGPHGGAKRGIKIERGEKNELFTVTTYNMDGNNPVWGNNIQMAPKLMRVVDSSPDRIVLKGSGSDMFGNRFSDYGMTIHLTKVEVEKCILHMHDRNIDIEYQK